MYDVVVERGQEYTGSIFMLDDAFHFAKAVTGVVADRAPSLQVVHYGNVYRALEGIDLAYANRVNPFYRALVAPLHFDKNRGGYEGEQAISALLSRNMNPAHIALLSTRYSMDQIASNLGVQFVDRTEFPRLMTFLFPQPLR